MDHVRSTNFGGSYRLPSQNFRISRSTSTVLQLNPGPRPPARYQHRTHVPKLMNSETYSVASLLVNYTRRALAWLLDAGIVRRPVSPSCYRNLLGKSVSFSATSMWKTTLKIIGPSGSSYSCGSWDIPVVTSSSFLGISCVGDSVAWPEPDGDRA